MKVIQIGSELALLCVAVHYQEGLKSMQTFLEVFVCGKNQCFQHGNQSYFLLILQVKLCFTLRFITAYYECKR